MARDDKTVSVSLPVSRDNRAVSPVIAVALMVGLAVALAGVLGVAATDFLDDVGSNPGATVTFDQNGSTVDITAQEIGDDVTSLQVRGDISSAQSFPDNDGDGDPDVGSVVSVTDGGAGLDPGDRITVVADDGNGNENTVGVYVVGETTS